MKKHHLKVLRLPVPSDSLYRTTGGGGYIATGRSTPDRQEHLIICVSFIPMRLRIPMTIRNTYSLIGIAALLIGFAVIFFSKQRNEIRKIFIYAEPIQTVYGWGYNILADEKIYIKQEYMPAVPGKQGFKSAADAMMVGNLVVKKITENKMPTITLHELDSMGLYKDSAESLRRRRTIVIRTYWTKK